MTLDSAKVREKVVVLLSGGIDSATALAIAKSENKEIYALTIDYGQKNREEIEAARRIALQFGVTEHKVILVELGKICISPVMVSYLMVEGKVYSEAEGRSPNYVPARNLIFLSLALSYAETVGASCILIGVGAEDSFGFPDARSEFLDAFENLVNIATGFGDKRIKVLAPLKEMSKGQIILKGKSLGVDFSITQSCYEPENGMPCGRCESCMARRMGFEEAGIEDS